jgi:hypothetical protein
VGLLIVAVCRFRVAEVVTTIPVASVASDVMAVIRRRAEFSIRCWEAVAACWRAMKTMPENIMVPAIAKMVMEINVSSRVRPREPLPGTNDPGGTWA